MEAYILRFSEALGNPPGCHNWKNELQDVAKSPIDSDSSMGKQSSQKRYFRFSQRNRDRSVRAGSNRKVAFRTGKSSEICGFHRFVFFRRIFVECSINFKKQSIQDIQQNVYNS